MTAERAFQIATIGVLSCERPDVLERALARWARHARVPIVVADDSRRAATRAANVEVLRRAARLGLELAYAGPVEKRAFADELAREARVPLEVVLFGLLDPEGVGTTIGANRNALLLGAAGTKLICCDDDVHPVLSRPLHEAEDLGSVAPGADATDFTFFSSRAHALASTPACDDELVALHEPWLGMRMAGPGAAKIVVTSTGILGDSGMHSPAGLLCSASPVTRANMARSEDRFTMAITSREVLRVASRPTLAPTLPLMGGSMGIDATELTPPFAPVLRNEDGIWGALTSRVLAQSRALHLPRALLHDAAPDRAYAPSLAEAGGISRQSCAVLAIAARHGFSEPTTAGRLIGLGARYAELAQLSPASYRALLRDHLERWAQARAARMLRSLSHGSEAPAYWKAAVHEHVDVIEGAARRGTLHIPSDLVVAGDVDAAFARSQALLARLGELLQAWPALFGAALRLRQRGLSLAQPIRGARDQEHSQQQSPYCAHSASQ